MPLKATLFKRVFLFGFNARTSRGAMKDRTCWFIRLEDTSNPELFGIGECAPLPGLSKEDITKMDEVMALTVGRLTLGNVSAPAVSGTPGEQLAQINTFLKEYFSDEFIVKNPSIVFALETALLDLINGGRRTIFDSGFTTGKLIPINGLIWMGGMDFMLQQIEIKIRDGYTCIKIKVGGIDFDKDVDILQYIRRKYFRDKIVVRLDANGAFKLEDASYKLTELARYDIHSIEQPIKTGAKELADLAKTSPIPVALDEELIGVSGREEKESLLDRIAPAFIILKPSLHGGMYGCQEWIELAEKRKIGWWMTSALESTIGLNAIAQFTANFDVTLPQGLGTGEIYANNILSPLVVDKGHLRWHPRMEWEIEPLFATPAPQ